MLQQVCGITFKLSKRFSFFSLITYKTALHITEQKKIYTVKYQFLSLKCNNIKTTCKTATKLEPPTQSLYVVGLDEIYFYRTCSISVLKSSILQIFFKHVPTNTIIYLLFN